MNVTKRRKKLYHFMRNWPKCEKSSSKILRNFFKTKIKTGFFFRYCVTSTRAHMISIFILYHSMSYFLLPFECSYTSLRLQLSISLFQILMDFFLLFHMSQNNFSSSIENNYFRT